MFNTYDMTKAFVSERQGTLLHEARQHRLGRGSRRADRTGRTSRGHWAPRLAALLHPRLVGASLSEPLLHASC